MTLSDPIYCRKIFLLTNCTIAEVNKKMKKLYGEFQDLDDDANGMYWGIQNKKTKTLHHYVWIEKFKNNPYDIALLGHELMHLVMAILKDAGMKLGDDSEEAYTYYFEYLLEQALIKLTK